jgi:hypothetical protein
MIRAMEDERTRSARPAFFAALGLFVFFLVLVKTGPHRCNDPERVREIVAYLCAAAGAIAAFATGAIAGRRLRWHPAGSFVAGLVLAALWLFAAFFTLVVAAAQDGCFD